MQPRGTTYPAEVPKALSPLLNYLGSLKSRGQIEEVEQQLRRLDIATEDLRDFVRFDPLRYTRNLVTEGEWFSVMVFCWRSGQRSVIHAHAESSCTFKVLAGVCSETLYRSSPCGQVVPQQTREFQAGDIVNACEAEPHQVSNLQALGNDLVTLHVYTPPLRSLQTFSIFGDGLIADGTGDGRGWLRDETKAVPRPDGPWLADEPFERLVRFMLAHLRHDMHVIDFARQTGHSEAHFSDLFKNRTGESPYHYFKRLRLARGREMILTGKFFLKHIAESVGYSNTDSFGEAFQAMFEESARQLLARARTASRKSRL